MVDEVTRAATVVVLFGSRGVGTHDAAAQSTLVAQLQQDLGGHDLCHHTGQLVGRAAAEHEMVQLVVGWQVTQLCPQRAGVDRGAVDQAVVWVDSTLQLVAPLVAQRLHRVGVTIEVDDALVVGRHLVERVGDRPDQVAVVVETYVVGVQHRSDIDDRVEQEPQPAALVVRQSTARVAATVHGEVDLVGGNADCLLQDRNRQRTVPFGQFGNPSVERRQFGHLGPHFSQHRRAGSPGRRPWLPPAAP